MHKRCVWLNLSISLKGYPMEALLFCLFLLVLLTAAVQISSNHRRQTDVDPYKNQLVSHNISIERLCEARKGDPILFVYLMQKAAEKDECDKWLKARVAFLFSKHQLARTPETLGCLYDHAADEWEHKRYKYLTL